MQRIRIFVSDPVKADQPENRLIQFHKKLRGRAIQKKPACIFDVIGAESLNKILVNKILVNKNKVPESILSAIRRIINRGYATG